MKLTRPRRLRCPDCGHHWIVRRRAPAQWECPHCEGLSGGIEPIYSEDGFRALLGNMVRQAVADLRNPKYRPHPDYACPRAFLEAAGLLRAGVIDSRLRRATYRERHGVAPNGN